MTTPGLTDRYLWHQNGLARTDTIDSNSPELAKEGATFVIHVGLAEGSCYAFESLNFPGYYLRHADFRVLDTVSVPDAPARTAATFVVPAGHPGVERA